MATHSSTLVWNIPWMEKPGSLQSMGSQRVGQDWATSLYAPDTVLRYIAWVAQISMAFPHSPLSFINSFTHLLVFLFYSGREFIHSFIHSFTYFPIYLFIHPLISLLTHLFLWLFTYLPTHYLLFLLLYCSLTHLLIF